MTATRRLSARLKWSEFHAPPWYGPIALEPTPLERNELHFHAPPLRSTISASWFCQNARSSSMADVLLRLSLHFSCVLLHGRVRSSLDGYAPPWIATWVAVPSPRPRARSRHVLRRAQTTSDRRYAQSVRPNTCNSADAEPNTLFSIV